MGGKQVGSLGLYHDVSDLVRTKKPPQPLWSELSMMQPSLEGPAIVERAIDDATEP